MFRCSRVRQITKDEHRGVWNKKGRAIHFFKWKIDEQYYYRLHSLFCPHGHHAVVVKDFFLPNLALSMQITTEPHTNTKHVIVKDKNNLKKKEINIYIFVITSSNTLKESVISVIINNYWSIDFWFSSLIRNFFFFFFMKRVIVLPSMITIDISIILSSASLAHLSFLDHPLPFFHWSSTIEQSLTRITPLASLTQKKKKKNTRYTSYVQTFKKREFICTYI